MAAQRFTNNAKGSLLNSVTASDTTLTLQTGNGTLFPVLTGGDWFLATLYELSGSTEQNHEIVKVTARSGDALTVTRAQEGTTARAFSAAAPVELRMTKGWLEAINNTSVTTVTASATTIELGHASDTTLARLSAGDISVEGNRVYRAGGTDVALADGGTGASLVDPNADRIMFWDDSAGAMTWLSLGSNLAISGTVLGVTGLSSAQSTLATTSGTVNIDWSLATHYKQTAPTGAITYTFTAPASASHLQLVIASATLAQVVTWPSLTWLGATWTGVDNKPAIINLWYDGTAYYAQGVNGA